ncbi:MAG: Phospholipase C 3 [Paracidovorax wautersii]|uniref:Phospholipase C 3 n=1 Tax=Paracidovorax wautersii TaxID=1177982 RepID=A0A7V8FQK7_9BURK|nr:MAG: Phospholipase C 3 [Paracidovorax wautersii]
MNGTVVAILHQPIDANMQDSSQPPTDRDPNTPTSEALNVSRRRLLGGALGAPLVGAATLSGCASAGTGSGATRPAPLDLDAALRDQVKTIVVIYGENRSFNNLFADFPGLARPLAQLRPADYQQRDRDGSVLPRLPSVPGGWLKEAQTSNGLPYPAGTQYQTNLPNAPFRLRGPGGENLPLGLVTRDLWHVFYQNQMQINEGRNDRFVAWADSGAFTMGCYANTSYALRLWSIAREFVLCDNFFQGAFGGSFLNHLYLVSATAPRYPNADTSIAAGLIATTVSGAPDDTRLKPLPTSPASALDGVPAFGPSALTPTETRPDGTRLSYGVNTMAPPYAPTWTNLAMDATGQVVDFTKPANASALPPQVHEHIGDKLDARGVEWAWYAGAYQQTLAQHGANIANGTPVVPNFQYHHQPFNYFRNLAPGTAARERRLRDGGLGDDESSNKFIADAKAGRLPAVTFYKPQGNLNLHAGYADVASGDQHIAHIVSVLRASPQWENMVVVITFDENGGWWDHVAPPKGDRWGPGSRIPALVVSPFARKGHVDHTPFDKASILRLITRTFALEPLAGLQERDQAMAARGQAPLGDLTHALEL